MTTSDYFIITELPGTGSGAEQVERLYQRYRFATEYSKNKDVLEVACGGGVGLGLLAKEASSVVGGDIDPTNVRIAQQTYQDHPTIRIHLLDACALPFEDQSFDTILLFEAIYYLSDTSAFFAECRRVLKPGGTLIIESANKEWLDFNHSAFSTQYYSLSELHELLRVNGFSAKMYKSYACETTNSLVSRLKRLAVKYHLIPRSMKFKQYLKRLVFGKLVKMPADISGFTGSYIQPEEVTPDLRDLQFKVMYAVATVTVPISLEKNH